jgi:hypothetical protein
VHVGVAPVHVFPHVPQLFGSFCVSMHAPLHTVGAVLGQVHVPALQLCPVAQTCPQDPQLFKSLYV